MTDPTRLDQKPLELTNAELQLIHKFDFRASATLGTIQGRVEMLIGANDQKDIDRYVEIIKDHKRFLMQRIVINEQCLEELKAVPKPAFQQLAQILTASNELFVAISGQISNVISHRNKAEANLLTDRIEEWKINVAPRFPANPAYAAFKAHIRAEDLEDTRNTIQ